ncbi:hypothetical protein [Citricoccus sp. GCM10030269]|uniref:hypothetical protein n=1 Tax=Citricoccus sp. GCM10030269 TaxID=3273388 RepID=UPI00360FDA91
MNTSRPTDQSSTDLRAAAQAHMQQQRQRPLPGWLAVPGRRRALALAPAVIFIIGVIAAILADTLGLLLMMVVAVLGIAGVLVLRRATQMLDTAPEDLLDEREISQRDRGYRDAFHLTLALLFVMWVLAVADGFIAKVGNTGLFDGDGWIFLTLASFFAIFMLPAASLTWRWPAHPDDQEG